MANNNKTSKFGSYICKVGDYLDIYQKTVYDESNGKKNLKIKSRELAVYHAKKKLVGGFKDKDAAVKAALEIIEGGMKKVNSMKSK